MNRFLIPAFLLLTAPAFAQASGGGFNGGANATSESTSGSQSYSGINFNQANGYRGTPSMGAPSMMGECGGNSGALSGPGFGLSLGGGNGSPACNLRADAAMLAALGGNQLAILHVCLSTKRGGSATDAAKTLQAAGLCPQKEAALAPARSTRPAAAPARARSDRAYGSVCEIGPSGALRVSVTPGFTTSQAARACRASLR